MNIPAKILKEASKLALKRKKKKDILEKESIVTAKKKKEAIKELKKQPTPKGLTSSPGRSTAAAQDALGKKSVTGQSEKGYRGEIKNIAVESKTPKAGVSSAGKKKIDSQVGKLKKQIKNAQRNPRLRRALAMDKRYGTVAQLQSKLKKLEKIQKKFTGPKDVKTFKGKELDKKLKELGIPKVSKVPPKPQKGPTRPINPEERSGRDYRIDVNRKREPEFFKGKDPYDPKQTSSPTNIEYAKKKKLKSGGKLRGMGKALRGGGKVMRG